MIDQRTVQADADRAEPIGYCPHCDYQLVAVGVCPECGETVTDQSVITEAQILKRRRFFRRLGRLSFFLVVAGGLAYGVHYVMKEGLWVKALSNNWLLSLHPDEPGSFVDNEVQARLGNGDFDPTQTAAYLNALIRIDLTLRARTPQPRGFKFALMRDFQADLPDGVRAYLTGFDLFQHGILIESPEREWDEVQSTFGTSATFLEDLEPGFYTFDLTQQIRIEHDPVVH